MASGLLIALVVTLVWVSLQIGLMHLRPAENRIRSMTQGYLISLPFVYVAYRWFATPAPGEAWAMGLVHAYLLHLLLYFFYVEGFYHVERAVTLRFLTEIMKQPGGQTRLADIMKHYNVREMVERRLEVLQQHQFVERRGDAWLLKPKGMVFARMMQFSSWVYQSKGQSDRL